MSTAITSEPIDMVLPRLTGVVDKGGGEFEAYCPVHEADGSIHNASLKIRVVEDGRVLMHCFGCGAKTVDIVHSIDLTMSNLFRPRQRQKKSSGKKSEGMLFPSDRMAIKSTVQFYEKKKWTLAGDWPYIVNGETVAHVLRFNTPDGKEFRPISKNGKGWVQKAPKEPRPLYCVDEIKEAGTAFILEGEKATDAARKFELPAVSSMNGAKSPRKSDWSPTAGKHIVIFPDCDQPGLAYANEVARLCTAAGALSVKVVSLPELSEGDDFVEWVASFGEDVDKSVIRTKIDSLVSETKEWTPNNESSSGPIVPIDKSELVTTIQNFELVEAEDEDGETKLIPSPLPITVVESQIKGLTGDWPRNVCGQLFVHNEEQKRIHWLQDSDAVFSHLGQVTGHPPHFKSNAGFHSKREVFSHLQRNTERYLAVEELPHEPPIAKHFYACSPPKSGSGETLRTLINRFSPETPADWDLMWAAFVTPFWGAEGGTRPAFCVTAPDRGAGKTKFVKFVANLGGGYLDISSNEDIATLKQRLLSTEASAKRVVLFDNIKTSKLSWAELESLITSPTVSGKRMYVGEFQRPNTFTYFLTMNGASFSRDMAQRCAVIKLKMPDYSGDWEGETQRFIDENRQALIDDVIGFLKQPSQTLTQFSRWADWERAVVSRLPDPSEVQAVIAERQIGVDIDNEESAVIEEFFAGQLSKLDYNVDTERVFIPGGVACKWLGWAMNDKFTTTKSSQMLKQRIEAKAFRCLTLCRGRANGRGFEFWGRNTDGGTDLRTDIELKMKMRGYSDV